MATSSVEPWILSNHLTSIPIHSTISHPPIPHSIPQSHLTVLAHRSKTLSEHCLIRASRVRTRFYTRARHHTRSEVIVQPRNVTSDMGQKTSHQSNPRGRVETNQKRTPPPSPFRVHLSIPTLTYSPLRQIHTPSPAQKPLNPPLKRRLHTHQPASPRHNPNPRHRSITHRIQRHRAHTEPSTRPIRKAPRKLGTEALAPSDRADVVVHRASGTHGVDVCAARGRGQHACCGARR